MGMFDNIIIKQNLPLPEELKKLSTDWKNYSFQTKDLDNCLLDFWISEEGELFEHVVERDYIPYSEEERKDKKISPWNMWKEVIEKNTYDKKINHHGVLKFYTYDEYDKETDYWVEFNAYFVYGKLDKFELLEFSLDKERKIQNKKWEEEYKRKLKHPITYIKKYSGWNWIWKKIGRIIYFFQNVLSDIQYFINRYIL